MSDALSIWITSGAAYPALLILSGVCVLAISIVHNRLEDTQFVRQALQRNSERIAILGSGAANPQIANGDARWTEEFRSLLEETKYLNQRVIDLTHRQLYGDDALRQNPSRWADRFHANANSDTMNVMIIGICACPVGLCAARLLAITTVRDQHKPTLFQIFSSVSILDVFLGMLIGLLVTFVIKSGLNVLSKTSFSTVDVSNPYGVAFVAAIAGFFVDKFSSWLEPFLATAK